VLIYEYTPSLADVRSSASLLHGEATTSDTDVASRKLLCFLFVRLGAMSTNSRGCRAPLSLVAALFFYVPPLLAASD
jgi:hypothetical protein